MRPLWPRWVHQEIVADVQAAHAAGEPPGLRTLLELTGAPIDELAPTVMSARVCAMAAARGHAFVHHERRVWQALPPALAPGGESASKESVKGPRWIDGVLELPKYFGAFLDAPLATYDPNHRHKWRSHELLHRCIGFYWSANMTRFEAYLGARLSELLPVVHWYALDEIGRPRCPIHVGRVLRREFCYDCESLRRPYWELDAPASDQIEAWFGAAKQHLEEEILVIQEEMKSGVPIASPRPGLDASSDARAYLDGHWERTTAWSFGWWVDLFGSEGHDYSSSISAMIARVQGTWAELQHGELITDLSDATRQRERQRLRDLGYRYLCALEWHDEESVWTGIEALAAAAAELEHGGELPDLPEIEEDLAARFEACASRFPEGVVSAIREQGLCFGEVSDGELSLNQVGRGLASAFPEVFGAGAPKTRELQIFVESAAFGGPGSIGERFARSLAGELDEATRLETWVRARPHRDRDGEDFGGIPEGEHNRADLRLNLTLRRGEFGAGAIERILGWRPDAEQAQLAAIYFRGEPRIIEVDESIALCFKLLKDRASPGEPDDKQLEGNEALAGLIEAGFVWWLPPAR